MPEILYIRARRKKIFFGFYRPLQPITATPSLLHSSLSFAKSTPSIQKFLLGWSIYLFFGLPIGLFPSGFQLNMSFVMPLDPPYFFFLPISVCIMSSCPPTSLISLLDLYYFIFTCLVIFFRSKNMS